MFEDRLSEYSDSDTPAVDDRPPAENLFGYFDANSLKRCDRRSSVQFLADRGIPRRLSTDPGHFHLPPIGEKQLVSASAIPQPEYAGESDHSSPVCGRKVFFTEPDDDSEDKDTMAADRDNEKRKRLIGLHRTTLSGGNMYNGSTRKTQSLSSYIKRISMEDKRKGAGLNLACTLHRSDSVTPSSHSEGDTEDTDTESTVTYRSESPISEYDVEPQDERTEEMNPHEECKEEVDDKKKEQKDDFDFMIKFYESLSDESKHSFIACYEEKIREALWELYPKYRDYISRDFLRYEQFRRRSLPARVPDSGQVLVEVTKMLDAVNATRGNICARRARVPRPKSRNLVRLYNSWTEKVLLSSKTNDNEY